jgi:hypothetical protein
VKEDFTGFRNAAHLNKSSDVCSNQSSAGDSDRETMDGTDARDSVRINENTKKPGACEQGRQTPGDSLFCAWLTLLRSF